jgi:glutamine synthetase
MTDLNTLTQIFFAKTGYQPLISAEIEFYLPVGAYILGYQARLERAGIETYGVEEERGENQFELALKNPSTPLVIAEQIVAIKKLFPEGNFLAKPYADQPGSGLHIHLNLLDEARHNPFTKIGDEEETPALRYAIAGLLNGMLEGFLLFAPNAESYARFSAEPLRYGVYNNAPVNVSWGGNNRTTAIRIPASSAWPQARRIEHRVAGADADPVAVIGAILLAGQQGLLAKQEPQEKIWGNATDKQYAPLPAFPKTLEEAQKIYNKSGLYDALGL